MRTRLHRIIVGASVASALLGTLTMGMADAATPPGGKSSVLHLDLQAGQMPENIVLDRHGSVVVTFAGARQVARITAAGRTEVLATLPAPADATAKTPLLGFPLTTGLARQGHTFYVLYATGTEAETGVWSFTEGREPQKFADLPADGLPNGLVMDPATGTLYVTESAKGAVYTVPTRGPAAGRATLFSDSEALAPAGFFGVNGAKIRNGDLYVSNTDKGTVSRTPLRGPRAGTFTTFADGLTGIDDFEFTGRGDEFLASLVTENTVVLADGTGARRVVLTQADGLSNPTSVAIRGTEVYVPSAAYTTQSDPNLLMAHLTRH
ncbi:hypothetical protein OG288_36675 [Streptomyces tauricus]|uniref:SMP-30/Gluconolactonase/LRE-like region domain-containing protein n=1 Tax=Streptomyces tauricus TaxID=68274 RepID=A0ABZ1JUG5_9ACTN|nr:hypothetical protein [Streptomyces tauricus]